MPLFSSYFTQPLVRSSLAVLPAVAWDPLIAELVTTVHAADFWRPEDFSKPISVGDVRQLLAFASHTGVGAERLAIVPLADRMGTETANALLKLLEEPPAGLVLLLLAETGRLLSTVRSRLALLEPKGLSATMKGEASSLESWRQALASIDLESPVAREEAARLLYLYPLVHQGIRPEIVLESVRHP